MYNFAASDVPFEFYQGQFLHLSNDVNHTFAPKVVVLMKHGVLIPLSPDFIFIASAFIMIYPVCPRFYCIENPNTFLIPCIFFMFAFQVQSNIQFPWLCYRIQAEFTKNSGVSDLTENENFEACAFQSTLVIVS